MRVGVILVAAGQGVRLGREVPKALVPLAGEPLVQHALTSVLSGAVATHVVVAAPEAYLEQFSEIVRPLLHASGIPGTVVAGGAERQESVYRALQELPETVDIVLVHDAARALASGRLFERVVAAVREETMQQEAGSVADADAVGVVPGLPVTDTLKQVDTDERVIGTPDRSALRAVQTPQGFRRADLLAAHERAQREAWGGVTDDAALIERSGGRVRVILGEERAAKVTVATDLTRLHQWLAPPESPTGPGAALAETTDTNLMSTGATQSVTAPAGAPVPVLLVVSGLPYSGKSTLARAWAKASGATHVRIDAIEQSLREAGQLQMGVLGYAAAMAIAREQLTLGHSVVADAVNPVAEARAGWAELARSAGARLVQVELVTSSAAERRSRAQIRDGAGHPVPDPDRSAGLDCQPWHEPRDGDRHRIDTADLDPQQVLDAVQQLLQGESDAFPGASPQVRSQDV